MTSFNLHNTAESSASADVMLDNFASIFDLSDKIAVVTGGSRGLGLHAASGLLQAGCRQVFITSRNRQACSEACEALNAIPGIKGRAISIPADLVKADEIDRLINEIKNHTDKVDVLLANAGATWGERFDTHPEEAFKKVLHLNVTSVFKCIQKFASLLELRTNVENPGKVIVTASVAGIGIGTLGEQGTYGYSASKAAVLSLVKNLAVELGPRHILINSISPGFFPSKMTRGLIELSGGPEILANSSPNGRLGKAEDFAAAVVYVSSRAGNHLNGSNITIDGGAICGQSRL